MSTRQTNSSGSRVGFLTVACGGVGLDAAEQYLQRYRCDLRPFPNVTIHIDTDPQTSPMVDEFIHIGFKDDQINALRADPAKFGRGVQKILENLPQFLSHEDGTHGSRTIRCLTQLQLAINEPFLDAGFRRAIHRLVNDHGVSTIIPMLVSSSGGGTGSALQILLPLRFREPSFRARALQGLPGQLFHTPITFISDPYALAQVHEASHAAKILANSYAYRIESVALEQVRAVKYVIHVGFANRHGVILSEQKMIGRVLGTSLYEWQRSWLEIKSRLVDTVDSQALSTCGYTGHDRPEDVLFNFFPARNSSSSTPNHADSNGQLPKGEVL